MMRTIPLVLAAGALLLLAGTALAHPEDPSHGSATIEAVDGCTFVVRAEGLTHDEGAYLIRVRVGEENPAVDLAQGTWEAEDGRVTLGPFTLESSADVKAYLHAQEDGEVHGVETEGVPLFCDPTFTFDVDGCTFDVTVTDLEFPNGTWVVQTRVGEGDPQVLDSGDFSTETEQFYLGPYTLESSAEVDVVVSYGPERTHTSDLVPVVCDDETEIPFFPTPFAAAMAGAGLVGMALLAVRRR